jgi:hypothetical protein
MLGAAVRARELATTLLNGAAEDREVITERGRPVGRHARIAAVRGA